MQDHGVLKTTQEKHTDHTGILTTSAITLKQIEGFSYTRIPFILRIKPVSIVDIRFSDWAIALCEIDRTEKA